MVVTSDEKNKYTFFLACALSSIAMISHVMIEYNQASKQAVWNGLCATNKRPSNCMSFATLKSPL
jgi:hypothetical protein